MNHTVSDQLLETLLEFGRLMHRRCAERKQGNWLQVKALGLIAENEGMTMTSFAEALDITSPSATSFVGRLVDLGWIERRTDSKNRKLVRLHLTEAGRESLVRHLDETRQLLREVHEGISAEDQAQLLRILKQMISLHRTS